MSKTGGSLYTRYMRHFSGNPGRDSVIYLFLVLTFLVYSGMAMFTELWVPLWGCVPAHDEKTYQNSLYDSNSCLDTRYFEIGFMTRREADFVRRIIASIVLGAIIGYERRSPDRAAGVRTMSITSLGACTFTLAGTFAFESGPMGWDSSRISASIPSGCGFLGAGLIWKGFVKQKEGEPDMHQVHGLTTAASIWFSAAVGVAAGGAMYVVAFFSTLTLLMMLRFGPRNTDLTEEDEDDQDTNPSNPQGDTGAHPAGSLPGRELDQRLLLQPGIERVIDAEMGSAGGSQEGDGAARARKKASHRSSIMSHN